MDHEDDRTAVVSGGPESTNAGEQNSPSQVLPRLFSEQESQVAEDPTAGPATTSDSVPQAPVGGSNGSTARGPRRRRSRLLSKHEGESRGSFTCEQRLLILDAWVRSKLPAGDFAPLVGLSPHTLYGWKKAFEQEGPAGLASKRRGVAVGSRLAEPIRRAILLMKQSHPEWGCERIHDMLMRTEGLAASSGAIANLLKQEGYEVEEVATSPHPPKVQRFERARPNQMWQSDLFTFVLKRQNRRVWMVVFMDDHSRFVVGYGLHATGSGALVREVLEAGIANYGAPEEVLTDNGTQYHTWRGQSEFSRLLARRGIHHILATPKHPQTLGKVERFWGTLWRECVELAIFEDLTDARKRIGLFIDHYNFQRTHSGIGGMVPADRYFGAASQVLATLKARVAANASELARWGTPRKSFYLAGRVGDQSIALHAEGSRVVLTREDGQREEVDLSASGARSQDAARHITPQAVEGVLADAAAAADAACPVQPGTSPLDAVVEKLAEAGLVVGSSPEAPKERP